MVSDAYTGRKESARGENREVSSSRNRVTKFRLTGNGAGLSGHREGGARRVPGAGNGPQPRDTVEK